MQQRMLTKINEIQNMTEAMIALARGEAAVEETRVVMADNLPQPALLVADRGCDSDKIREDIETRNALPFVRELIPQINS